MNAYLAILRKDLALELRTREAVPAMALFSLSTFVVFHFALDRSSLAGDLAAGVFWVTLLFAAMLGIGRLFVAEQEDHAIDGVLIAPLDRTVLLFAKCSVLLIYLALLEIVALPAFSILLLGPSIGNLLPDLLLILLLANIGVATVGTLISALATNTRASELIVPLLGLPLLIPIVLAAAKTTSPLMLEHAASVPSKWLAVLGLYDIVFGLVAYGVFDFLWDD